MPIYDYQCDGCGAVEERRVSVADRDSKFICGCGRPLKRVAGYGTMQWSKWGTPDYDKYRWPQKTKRNIFTGAKTHWAENGE